jgi:class 3 adenylate cyclase
MSKIIGKFGGRVIKNIGDCLLYYFPNHSDPKNEDFANCLDCGLAMVDAHKIICEQLELQKLPSLSYRISADWGSVLVMNTTDSSAVDLIGPPVNMCTKINHCAISNEFVIGGDLYEVVKKFARYSFQEVQSCSVGFKHSYPVYKVCQQF